MESEEEDEREKATHVVRHGSYKDCKIAIKGKEITFRAVERLTRRSMPVL